jgi:hypothetical protein
MGHHMQILAYMYRLVDCSNWSLMSGCSYGKMVIIFNSS